LSPFLKPNIGLSCNAFPTDSNGAILEFTMGEGIKNDDEFMDIEPTVSDALSKIEQKAFGGNLSGFQFGGTNVIAEGNRIIIIKGDDNLDQWDDRSANDDVKKFLPTSKKNKQ
jgi:hypothetical protein